MNMRRKIHDILIKKNKCILNTSDYRDTFESEMLKYNQLDYFDRIIKGKKLNPGNLKVGMLKFSEGEWVPGSAWSGNYGMFTIVDFREYKSIKGRKRIEIEGGYDFADSPDMNELIPYPLQNNMENILQEIDRKKFGLYNVPSRFTEKYKNDLTIMIGGTKCQESKLTEKMLKDILLNMTQGEKAKYEQSLFKINVSLYPSIELPVKVRIGGTDDGAEECLFEDFKSANEAINEITIYNSVNNRRIIGFKTTD